MFRTVSHEAEAGKYTSWNQIEEAFLASMSSFDTSIAASAGATLTDDDKSVLGADLQNGKGDFFNDLLVLLLENCSGVDLLATRRIVPGLIVPRHNLDGVFPATGQVPTSLALIESSYAANLSQATWGGSEPTGAT
ncbi:MAG TPA: hypothetical protein VK853_05450 [Ilumatobacteraceae bacterium]|nr:hypothetical protein [Ilumatobacteraceae bacterium]